MAGFGAVFRPAVSRHPPRAVYVHSSLLDLLYMRSFTGELLMYYYLFTGTHQSQKGWYGIKQMRQIEAREGCLSVLSFPFLASHFALTLSTLYYRFPLPPLSVLNPHIMVRDFNYKLNHDESVRRRLHCFIPLPIRHRACKQSSLATLPSSLTAPFSNPS